MVVGGAAKEEEGSDGGEAEDKALVLDVGLVGTDCDADCGAVIGDEIGAAFTLVGVDEVEVDDGATFIGALV